MANVSQNVASELWQVSKIEGFEFLSPLTLTVFDKLPSPLPIELLTKGLNCAALLIYLSWCRLFAKFALSFETKISRELQN